MASEFRNYRFYDDDAMKRIREMSECGATFAFVYSETVLSGGAVKGYKNDGERAVFFGGEIFVPISFFTDFISARIDLDKVESRVSGGITYVPLKRGAESLGKSVGIFYDGRLAVVGTPAIIREISESEALVTAAAYAVFGEYDPYKFTPEDYKVAREKWRRLLVGTPETVDLSDPTVKAKVDALSATAKKLLTTMNTSPDRKKLWGEGAPTVSDDIHNQYSPLATLARAYGTYGCEYYRSEEVKRVILDGVQWMYENMYGEAEIEGRGWRDAHLFNWYHWFISASEFLTDIFFIMEDDFTLEDRRKYLRCFEWCSTFMRHWFARETSSSRICVRTKVALACEYPEHLYEEYVDFDVLLTIYKTGEGPHIDYAQWCHGMPYNTHYGIHNLDRVMHTAANLSGTPLAFRNPKLYNQYKIVKYMFEPALYHGRAMLMLSGRRTATSEKSDGGLILGEALVMYGMFGEEEDEYVTALVKRCAYDEKVIKRAKAVAPIERCALIEKMLASDTPISEYKESHSYFTADRAIVQGGDHAVGIALSSSREKAWESINGENKNAWHTGDGATYLYTDYDSEAFDKDNFYLANENIAYRFPGTTEDSRKRVARSICYSRDWKSPEDFAGSVKTSERELFAAMKFSAYNFVGEDDRPDDRDSGGGLPPHENDLVAKKSYFCIDGKTVCLGAGIKSTMNSPVSTTVEHKRLVSPESDKIYIDGELMPSESYSVERDNIESVLIEGHAGYVNLGKKPGYVRRYECESAGGQSYIEIGLSHGVNPDRETYAYAILPGATQESLAEYAKDPGFNILENSERLAAIRKSDNSETFYVFYEAYDRHGIMADDPCMVYKSTTTLTVCEPTHKLDKIKVTVWEELTITDKDERMDIDIRDGRTIITINTEGAVGAPISLHFKSFNPTHKYKVSFTDEEYARTEELLANGAAAFIYSKKFLVKGENRAFDDAEGARAIAKGGLVYVPVSFFEKHLGYDISGMPEDIFAYDGKVRCVNAMECARALGLSARTFYEDRLFIVADESVLDEISKNEGYEESAAYAVFGEYGASGFTSEDYKLAKDLWRLRIVGSKEINDLSDEVITGKIEAVARRCRESLESYNRNADRVILWGENPPVESDDLWVQYKHIENLAVAWGTYGCEYYHSDEILEVILEALEWMYINMYGESVMENRGWRSVHTFNWWHWYVGASESLTNIMLVIEDHLTMEKKWEYLKCYRWVRTVMYNAPRDRAGASGRILAGAKCALLLEDADYLERLQVDCDSTMSASEYGAGIHKADYVNWTHSYPHNISYGVVNIQRGLFAASILAATPLDVSGPKRYNQFNLIKYCYEPAMYRMQGFVMFSGRSTFGVEANFGASILSAALPMIGCFGEDEDRYLKRFIKRHATTQENINRVKSGCSIYYCALLNEILADDSIPAENDYEYAHAWFTGDRAAQHRDDYAIGIAMSSRREMAWESINSANKTGWHTGDGATYLYTKYDGNQFDGKNFILNNENVAYRFPGTTEDAQPRVARSISNQYHYIPENTFAGSLQVENKYIAAGMDFIAFHNEGPDEHPDDYGYGGSNPVHQNDLVAKKAWFCLDGEIVCLGAGITSTMNSPVATTVEHRRIVNKEKDRPKVSYATCSGADSVTYAAAVECVYGGARYALIDGHAGYIFAKDTDLKVRRYTHAEAEEQDFIEIGIQHGINPDGGKYEYIIMPYATEEKIEKYISSPTVKTVNTPECQAVTKESLGLSLYVFHNACECDGIKVSAPCILSVSEKEGVSTLSVSDATHKAQYITVTLKGKREIISASQKASVDTTLGDTEITFNVAFAHGRKFEVKYK